MKVIPVIVRARRQAHWVDILARYCMELDGTKLRIIEAEELDLPYPDRNNRAFWQACQAMKGKPFLWMEPDSIPLRKGWLAEIEAVYDSCGRSILISSDSNPPYDQVGGIGVYGPDAHPLFPERLGKEGFDGWMMKHLGHMITRHPIIQHSYGNYLSKGRFADHRFPRDRGVIRADAAIFHRDAHADLIPGKSNRFVHHGDLGDVIASLASIRHLGGGHLMLTENFDMPLGKRPRESMRGARYAFLEPLLASQPFVTGVEWSDSPEAATHDFTRFRTFDCTQRSLLQWQAAFIGLEDVDESPWLTVEPKGSGRVVVARSLRYRNGAWPIQRIAKLYGDRMLFVGLPEEHTDFETECGRSVEYIRVSDALEMAQILAGADLVVANQSCPLWLAYGVGAKVLVECWPKDPNSIVRREGSVFLTTMQEIRAFTA